MIYLDNAASTPLLSEVIDDLYKNLNIFGNPSSIHDEGIRAKALIDKAKLSIAKHINCKSDELYFTSGATMSNNLILQGFRGDVAYSAIEHDDIQLMAKDNNWTMILVDSDGCVSLNDLQYVLSLLDRPLLVSIQCANSEIGTIQNIQLISEIVHKFSDCYLHVDATQYIPYFELDAQKLKIDSLSMSGQKIGCIKGVGLLYISDNLKPLIKPIIYGKQGLIGGTENVLGINCLGVAFENISYDIAHMSYLRNKMINELSCVGTLVGSKDYRLPNNVCMLFDGVDATQVVMLLNEHGICCSSGSACSSGDSEPSATLLAIGLTPEQANSCVRFTLSRKTTEHEIDVAIDTTIKVVRLLRELNG